MRKDIKMTSKILVTLFLVFGMFLISANGSKVFASEIETNDVITQISSTDVCVIEKHTDISKYRTNGVCAVPYPTTADKTDWIFAGWFTNEGGTTYLDKSSNSGEAYAKFVPAELLNVKCQVTAGTDAYSDAADLRLVTSVPSRDYQAAGFDVYYNNNTKAVNCEETVVFKRINSNTNGLEFGYSPKAIDEESEYFVTHKLVNIINKNFDKKFEVKPYWITLDGTKVYGIGRTVRVSDSYNKVITVPIRSYATTEVTEANLSVSYDSAKLTYIGLDNGEVFGTVTADASTAGSLLVNGTNGSTVVPYGMVGYARFKIISDLDSTTNFSITGAELGESKVYYKYYSMDYDGTPDTSWYDYNPTATSFVISTPADLYGLAEILTDYSTNKENFAKNTIYLASDITVNKGDASTWTSTTTGLYAWTPIGNTTSANFNGIFDGQDCTIKGLYLSTDQQNVGLFGVTNRDATIKNVRLDDSYFYTSNTNSNGAVIGSIVGLGYSLTMESVYSGATVESAGLVSGGLVGRLAINASGVEDANQNKITDCWFAGKVISSNKRVGGIVGDIWNLNYSSVAIVEETYITGCLNTGLVKSSWNTGGVIIGGFCGKIEANNALYIEDSMNVGEINSAGQYCVGSIVGEDVSTNVVISVNNTYTTSNITNANVKEKQTGFGNMSTTVSGTVAEIVETESKGFDAIDTATQLSYYVPSTNEDGYWILKENGLPELLTFVASEALYTPDTSWYSDDSSTFEISTVNQLYGLAKLSETTNFANKTITVTKDLEINNAGSAYSWTTHEPMYSWIPIGKTTAFNGTFDGDMKTISGLYLDTSTSLAGMFAQVGGTIKEFKLKNSYFESTYSGNYAWLGSVTGFLSGQMESVYSDAIVTCIQPECGGIVGRFGGTNQRTIKNCWFDGNVTTATKHCGGIVGLVQMGTKTITNCLNTGTVESTYDNNFPHIGGIVGAVAYTSNNGGTKLTIDNVLNTGTVIAKNSGAQTVGAIVGRFEDATISNVNYKTSGTINKAYYTSDDGWTAISTNSQGTTTLNDVTAKIVDSHFNARTEANLIGTNGFRNTELDFDTYWAAVENGTPILRTFLAESGETEADTSNVQRVFTDWYYHNPNANTKLYTIHNAEELYGFAEISQSYQFSGDTVEIAENTDIIVNEGRAEGERLSWTPIGNSSKAFLGIFEGNGNTISGIYYNGNQMEAGLFAWVNGGTIRNFSLTDSDFTSSNTYLGSVVGFLSGDMENVYSSADVTTSNKICGGLVGAFGSNNTHTMDGCWFDGTVTSSCSEIKQCVGGLVGLVDRGNKTLINCYNSGSVTETFTIASYELAVAGLIGGICNESSKTSSSTTVNIEQCVNTGAITVAYPNGVGDVIGASYATNSTATDYANTARATVNIELTYAVENYKNTASTTTIGGSVVGLGNGINMSYINGNPMRKLASEMQGVNSYKYTELDFVGSDDDGTEDVWTARTDDTLGLAYFVLDSDKVAEDTIRSTQRVYTNWYYNNDNTTSTTYTISNAEELFGMAYIVNSGALGSKGAVTMETFSGEKVELGANITANPEHEWTPIGNATTQFKGTFEGNGNTISGLTVTGSKTFVGLFGYTVGSTLQNFSLVNSTFTSTNTTNPTCIGSIAGRASGTFTNVYSNADVTCSGYQAGGFVGRLQEGTATQHTFTECWYAGNLTMNGTIWWWICRM